MVRELWINNFWGNLGKIRFMRKVIDEIFGTLTSDDGNLNKSSKYKLLNLQPKLAFRIDFDNILC